MQHQDTLKLIFGIKVAYLRQQAGLNYQQLSERTGLSVGYLHDIEKGKKYPKIDKIQILAQALSVSYDELISLHRIKKLQPIIDLLESEFFKIFPMEMFGISPDKLLDLFANAPDKLNAFISTILKIARNYQVRTENLYTAALRSYQDLNDNYLADIEESAQQFRTKREWETLPVSTTQLETALKESFNISVNRETFSQFKELRSIRSFYAADKKCLYLNSLLSEVQANFLMAREIGFQVMEIQERPFETRIQRVDTFEKLLNNYRASYFAAALLMGENELTVDIQALFAETEWHPTLIEKLLEKYGVTPETFLQRMTTILPKHFGIKNLFFIRLHNDENLKSFQMTKEIHLSRIHSPYANELNEHYCRRWISIKVLAQLRTKSLETEAPFVIGAQVSSYWQTENNYICISMAQTSEQIQKESMSVTIGILIDDSTKRQIKFLSDPALPHKVVHTTCERCSMTDCGARVAAPVVIEREKKIEMIEQRLQRLNSDL
jgi:transcriptional regulator with XRE-family HTH domain/Zn-dependent peptidase ImmA (M78 family)